MVVIITVQIECAREGCYNSFTPKNAQHGFCSAKCRRAARGSHWRFIREAVLIRDQDTCQDCNSTDCPLDVHHLIPLCKRGTNRLYNLVSLCRCCHRQRHRSWKENEAYEAKDALRSREDEGGYYAA